MKIVACGDTHGRLNWKDIVAKELESSDKIVFIGDYFDTHDDVTPEQQLSNFNEIVEYKKTNMDKIILLIGNHDFHYLTGVNESYSGFQYGWSKEFNKALEAALAEGLMQMCYVHDKYVFTHAGVTNTWCITHNVNRLPNKIESSINELFKTKKYAFYFQMGHNYSQSGDDVTQSPIWVRIPSLFNDGVDGFTFVVGHSTLKELTITDKIIGIDTLGVTGEYLVIDNKKITAEKP
jgi:predicted phosphodiesterase